MDEIKNEYEPKPTLQENKVALCFIVSYAHVLNQESLGETGLSPTKTG